MFNPSNRIGSLEGRVSLTETDVSSIENKEVDAIEEFPLVEKFQPSATQNLGASDMPSLTVTGLVIGEDYEISGQVRFYSSDGVSHSCYISSGINTSGAVYKRLWFDPTSAGDNSTIAISVKFNAFSTSVFFYDSRGAAGDYIMGNNTRQDTFIQVKRIPKVTKVKIQNL